MFTFQNYNLKNSKAHSACRSAIFATNRWKGSFVSHRTQIGPSWKGSMLWMSNSMQVNGRGFPVPSILFNSILIIYLLICFESILYVWIAYSLIKCQKQIQGFSIGLCICIKLYGHGQSIFGGLQPKRLRIPALGQLIYIVI